ncbi:MAG: YcfL family protein [Planctomycetota bacterium]
MARFAVLAAFVAAVGCGSDRYRAARSGEDVEAKAQVAIHPDIEKKVTVVKRSASRTHDGRLHLQVVLGSETNADRALLVRTDWLDENGVIVGQSGWRTLYLPGGSTAVYESDALDARATAYGVSIRPASTDREG